MKRLLIFAGYNKKEIIDFWTIKYIKSLLSVVDNIIIVYDNFIKDKESKKLLFLEKKLIYPSFERHNEYDFGSYKKGYLFCKKNNILNNYDEILFCNDSCYSLINDWTYIFDYMNNKKCDFWGLIKSNEILEHIQSYFLVIKKNVFLSPIFDNFISNVKHFDDKSEIINNYEVGLTQLLLENNFKYETYIDNQNISKMAKKYSIKQIINNYSIERPDILIELGFPLLKKSLLNNSIYIRCKKIASKKFNSILPTIFHCIKNKIIRFLYQNKINKKGKKIIRICRIPIYIKKI